MRTTTTVATVTLGLLLLAAPARAEQGSLADRCPVYVEQLEEARDSLSNSDRTSAVKALRLAQEALRECIRIEAEIEGLPTMLAGRQGAAERA